MPSAQLPFSTPGCLVFLYDKVKKRFKTAHYSSFMTQGRATSQEIESFLKEISIPISRWTDEYEDISEAKGTYGCLLVFTFLLLPLFFFYLCWLSTKQSEAKEKLFEAREETRKIIQERGSLFTERGLMWNIPEKFPEFIELWIPSGGMQMIIVQQPHPGYFGINIGIPTQSAYSTISSSLSSSSQRGHVSFQGMQQRNKKIMMPGQQQNYV